MDSPSKQPIPPAPAQVEERTADAIDAPLPPERGGRDGPEPTRYGDWEVNGRCVDF